MIILKYFKYFKGLYFIAKSTTKRVLTTYSREKLIILLNIILFCWNKMDRT